MSQFAYDPNPSKTPDYRTTKITQDTLHLWSKDNFYRTSYISSYTNKPQEPKNQVIPGYGGFVPGLKSRAEFGRNFAQIAKDSFSKPDLGNNKFGLSSTGFNLNPKLLADDTLTAMTHKFGSSTMQKTHPSLAPSEYISHTHKIFSDPSKKIPPTYRPSSVDCVNPKVVTKKSGYSTNSVTFDGKGLLPKEETNIPRQVTEYRNRFNTEKPIHINHTIHQARSLHPFTNTFNVGK